MFANHEKKFWVISVLLLLNREPINPSGWNSIDFGWKCSRHLGVNQTPIGFIDKLYTADLNDSQLHFAMIQQLLFVDESQRCPNNLVYTWVASFSFVYLALFFIH